MGKIEIELDAFDCSICQEAMIMKIFQCPSGHSVCEDCYGRLREPGKTKSCPQCKAKYPTHPIRNLSMESLVAQCPLPCRNGCGFRGKPSELQQHATECKMRPLPCPVKGCHHKCPAQRMREHVEAEHAPVIGKHLTSIKMPNTDMIFSRLILYERGPNFLLLCDRRFENGAFRARAVHF